MGLIFVFGDIVVGFVVVIIMMFDGNVLIIEMKINLFVFVVGEWLCVVGCVIKSGKWLIVV